MSMLNLVASLVKTGIHGRVFSSDGRPLPASIAIKGINYNVSAGQTFGDYHRLLTPGEKYEVVASMSGYKSKSTHVILGDKASSVDFILDPLIMREDGILLKDCDCSFSNSSLKLTEILPGQRLGIFLVLLSILVFLCFLMKRKAMVNHLRQRQTIGPKRPLVV